MPFFEPTLGPALLQKSKFLLVLITASVTAVGLILVAGGIYLALTTGGATIIAKLFGTSMSSTSIGFAMAFLGTVVIVTCLLALLNTIVRLAALPDTPSDSLRQPRRGAPR